jgi:hypothetical protein
MFNQKDFDQFDKVLDNVKPDLKGLSFCKQVSSSVKDTEYKTYRRRIRCKDSFYFDSGFGHDETEAWYYITFLISKKKYTVTTAQKIAGLLGKYNFNDEDAYSYRVVAVERLENWTTGNSINAKKITDWFKARIQEVKDRGTDI